MTRPTETMTRPTEMTIATGTTVYAGDPESDERIQSREVRVQVTYRIDEEGADVPLLAGVKAAELERVHRAVCAVLRAPNENEEERQGEEAPDPAGLEAYDPGPEPPDDPATDPFPDSGDYTGRTEGPRPEGQHNGGYRNGGPAAYQNGGPGATAPATPYVDTPGTQTDWAIKPQILAIVSHFKRLGLSPENQTALLRARFGKFRPERLTKNEAADLMRSLERGELELERGELKREEREPAGAAAH